MPTLMLGPADMTIASARYHDALALAARMRLIDEANAAPPRDPRVFAGRALVRAGEWLIATVQPMMPSPAHAHIGGEQ